MYKFFSSALVSLALVSHAGAVDLVASKPAEFYRVSGSGGWTIYGTTAYTRKVHNDVGPHCILEKKWHDGSRFNVYFDLSDGEVYVSFSNVNWQIGDPIDGSYQLRMNFHWSDGKINGSDWPYELLTKNIIRLRRFESTGFMQDFIDAKELRLVLPGNISNATISLRGTYDARLKLRACLEASNKTNLYPAARKDQSRFPMGEIL